MIKGKALILDKTDIKEGIGTELTINDLKQKSFKEISTCDIAIATTESGETIVLKNRTGSNGIVVPLHTYKEFLNWLNENNKPNIASKKESFVGRVFKFNFWPFNRS